MICWQCKSLRLVGVSRLKCRLNSNIFLCIISLPYNKEGIAINMPWLHRILPILEHNLHILMEISTHHSSLEVGIASGGRGRDASNIENSGNVEVVSKFQWSVWCNIRYTVDSIPLLAIYVRSRVCKHDGSSRLDQSIVIRSLRVWSWSTCCQVPPGFRSNNT